MGRSYFFYRLEIRYPDGSHEKGWPTPGWRPESISDEEWETYPHKNAYDGTFRWPRQKMFRSAQGAYNRARLFEEYGCTVHVERSKPIEWESVQDECKREKRSSDRAIKIMYRILEETSE